MLVGVGGSALAACIMASMVTCSLVAVRSGVLIGVLVGVAVDVSGVGTSPDCCRLGYSRLESLARRLTKSELL